MKVRKPEELEARNKDLENLEELNPPLPQPVDKKKDAMGETFGQEEEEEDETKVKSSSLKDFIEVIIKIGR